MQSQQVPLERGKEGDIGQGKDYPDIQYKNMTMELICTWHVLVKNIGFGNFIENSTIDLRCYKNNLSLRISFFLSQVIIDLYFILYSMFVKVFPLNSTGFGLTSHWGR